MKIVPQPLPLGQNPANREKLTKAKLTTNSYYVEVMTENAVNLIKENQRLTPGCFEKFRAKSVGVIIGGALPLLIASIFGLVIYGLYQTGTLTIILQKTQVVVSDLATKVFTAMTANTTAVAATTGGALIATFAITREPVYNAIGSFFGSLFGSFAGTSIAHDVRETQIFGYDWWYDSYHFEERLKTIQSNNNTIVAFLSDAYNDMALDLDKTLNKVSHDAKALQRLKDDATALNKQLPIIQAIFEKQGITHNKAEEITLQLEKSIGAVLASQTN